MKHLLLAFSLTLLDRVRKPPSDWKPRHHTPWPNLRAARSKLARPR